MAQAEDIGANSKIKGLRAIAKVKAQIDKATAIYELTLALAKDPAAAFAKTYAVWGWPLGAIFGAIAQVATYASLIAGIASIKGMAQGGPCLGRYARARFRLDESNARRAGGPHGQL